MEIPNGEAIVPFEVDSSGHPAISCSVDGGAPSQFEFDTGAFFAADLDEDFASANRMERYATSETIVDCNGTSLPTEFHPINRFTIGSMTFKNFDALVAPEGPALFPASGRVGWHFFEGLTVTLDYPNGRFSISRAGLPPPDGRQVFQLKVTGDHLCVSTTVSGRESLALVDTCGAVPVAIWVGQGAADKVTFLSHRRISDESKKASWEHFRTLDAGTISDICIGRYRFAEPLAAVYADSGNAVPVSFLLGPPILSHFRVTFDLHNMRMRLSLPHPIAEESPDSQITLAPPDRPCTLKGPLRVNGVWIPAGNSTTLPANEVAEVQQH